MITYRQARRRVLQRCRSMALRQVKPSDRLGAVIAGELRAGTDWPCFDNSAMDGYAIRSRSTAGVSPERPLGLRIAGSIRAGDRRWRVLAPMSAYAIMTGATVPEGADAVIEKERVTVLGGRVRVMHPVTRGRNIRRRAEELTRGSKLGVHGAVITPGLVGFLACVGLPRVPVHGAPKVGLIVTGDELARPGSGPLPRGRIYDSNTPMLTAALRSSGVLDPSVSSVKDDPESLGREVRRALRRCDVVVLTGGVSVGDHDPVKRVLKSCGVKCDFWRVRQKPGKPVYFGWKGRKLVFGLPGNPASAHACFYQYVYPCLRKLMGHRRTGLPEERLPLEHAMRPDPDKTLILRARLIRRSERSWCRVLGKQGSHMLSSMRRTEGFAVIDPGRKPLRAGSPVVFQRLTGADG